MFDPKQSLDGITSRLNDRLRPYGIEINSVSRDATGRLEIDLNHGADKHTIGTGLHTDLRKEMFNTVEDLILDMIATMVDHRVHQEITTDTANNPLNNTAFETLGDIARSLVETDKEWSRLTILHENAAITRNKSASAVQESLRQNAVENVVHDLVTAWKAAVRTFDDSAANLGRIYQTRDETLNMLRTQLSALGLESPIVLYEPHTQSAIVLPDDDEISIMEAKHLLPPKQ